MLAPVGRHWLKEAGVEAVVFALLLLHSQLSNWVSTRTLCNAAGCSNNLASGIISIVKAVDALL
jgi:hypothetical protein